MYLKEKAEKKLGIKKAELQFRKMEMESNRVMEVSLQKQQQQFMEFQKTMMEQYQQQQA